jgi:hypothetical protein
MFENESPAAGAGVADAGAVGEEVDGRGWCGSVHYFI